MKKVISLKCGLINYQESAQKLSKELDEGNTVELLHPKEKNITFPKDLVLEGPGIIISSSGSAGSSHHCLHRCSHLDQSAHATAHWLRTQNIQPERCHIFNPLPFHHVSGLMPWWRSRQWGTSHEWVTPSLMKDPSELAKKYKLQFSEKKAPLLISLVPIQLKRLLENESGINWLKCFSVVWVGGSLLSSNLIRIARSHKIRLAPCYGTTETMAMVTALKPQDFLKGHNDLGAPLIDIELRLSKNNALEIRTSRLALTLWQDNKTKGVRNKDGWWQSADAAEIIQRNNQQRLLIKGRLDNAIHSGAETIFPERLQERLLKNAYQDQLPIQSIFLTSHVHEEWGDQLIALVRLNKNYSQENLTMVFTQLVGLVKEWLPAEKPFEWYHCPKLKLNANGKWDTKEWALWAKKNHPIISRLK